MKPIQEPDVVERGPVILTGTLIVAFTAIGVLCAGELQSCTHEARGGRPLTGSAELDPPDEIGAIEMGRFVEHRAVSTRRLRVPALEEYQWADREAGLVRIPIRRAMEAVIDRAGRGADRGEP